MPSRDLRISILSGVSYRSSPLLRRLALAAPLVTIALLPVPALAAGSGLSPLLPAGVSPNGQRLYDLYNLISIPAIIVFVLVEALLLTIVIRDRRRRQGPDYRPPQWHGNTRLEVAWTVAPFLLMVAIGALSFGELQRDFQRPFGSPSDLEINVTAHQFGWSYAYPQGFAVASEGNASVQPLVVPTGRLVRLKIDSEDVIHSWWVPDIAGKTDAVPGYDNYTWFNIQQVGQYRGECAELCGAGHYSMQIMVKAVTSDEFDTWVAEQQAKQAQPSPSPSAAAGAAASPSPSASASGSPSPRPLASATPSPSPSR
jgi:cytochrome c oxidase subunit 2